MILNLEFMKDGFTIVELLIVIAITIIVAVVTIPVYGNLQASSQLNETSSQLIQIIRMAQLRSMSRLNNNRHGVKIEPDSFVIYQGDSYATRNIAYDLVTNLDDILSLSSNLTGDEINFSLGLGKPNSFGTITLTHGLKNTKQIVINSLGLVEEN